MPILDTIPQAPGVLITLAIAAATSFLVKLLLSYTDGRGIGTSRREDVRHPVKGTFLLGNVQALQANMTRSSEWYLEILENNPDCAGLAITMPFERMIMVSTPEELEYVQQTHFSNFVKGDLNHDCMNVLGEGIFTTDGAQWSAQRKATTKIFTANAFRGTITDSVETTLLTLRTLIEKRAAKSDAFDIQAVFYALILDSFSKTAFGKTMGALTADAPIPFASALDYVQGIMIKRYFMVGWKITELFSAEGRRMKKEVKTLDDFVYGLMDERASDLEPAGDEDVQSDLLSFYTNIKMEDGSSMTRVGVRDAVLSILIAGRDTTAQSLSWIMFHLISKPELVAKARAELDNSPPVTYDTFRSFTYLNAIFNEGLRLHPSVPAVCLFSQERGALRRLRSSHSQNNRVAVEADQLPNGVRIEAGDTILWSDWAMGRLTSNWGDDAREFKPERWIQDGTLLTASSWKLHTFNGGPRLALHFRISLYAQSTAARMRTRRSSVKMEDAPATPTPDPTPAPSRAKFSALPREVTARIVWYAKAQDREHEEYLASCGKKERKLAEGLQTPWHGRSLFALSEVSQDTRGLCAEYLFAVLAVRHDPQILRQSILPKYSKYIKSVDLRGAVESAKKLFAILPRLPRLEELVIDPGASRNLFGSLITSELPSPSTDSGFGPMHGQPSELDYQLEARELRLAILDQVAGKLKRLVLSLLSPDEMGELLGKTEKLESLSIVGVDAKCHEHDTPGRIAFALANAPHLKQLDIKCLVGHRITPPWATCIWPAITSLTLRDASPTEHTFYFIDAFDSTLTSLTLSFRETTPPAPLPSHLFLSPFPRLEHLSLTNADFPTARLLLDALASPSVKTSSPLRLIQLRLSQIFPTPTELRDVVSPFSTTLRELLAFRSPHAGQINSLVGDELGEHICLHLGIPDDHFFTREPTKCLLAGRQEDNGEDYKKEVSVRGEALKATLDFGNKYVKKLVTEGDVEGMNTAFRVLEKLRVLQKIGGS
ncbi:hypothetical protein P7C70_g2807, partial [Phenoliferia sp. Uapishka_3]